MAQTFRINVVIDPSRAKTGAQEAGRQLDKVNKKASTVGKTLRRAFGLIGGALVLRSSIGILASFSQEMSTVGAVSNATADEMLRLEERALSLGKTTRFTATEAAAGLTELARAGLEVDESIEAIGTSLTLAQAGGVSIADAAAITTTALKIFNIEAENSVRVADVLVIAANSAKTNVGEMGQAFTFVAANANDLNISMEDTAAALGVLAEGGLAATRGGTALRAVLLGLAAPTREAEAALASAGLTLEDIDIKTRGLVPVLQTLSDAQLDSAAKAAIFGKRFSAASSILFNKLDKFDEISNKFKTLGGEALRVSEAMDDNLNGALLRARSAFQGFVLSIGQSGGLTTLTDTANGLAVAFNFLGDNVEALGVSLAVLAVGFTLVKVSMSATVATSLAATAAFIQQALAASILTVGLGGVGGAAAVAAAGLKAVALASIANPFVLIAVGAVAAFVAIKELTEGIEEYTAALEIADAGEFSGLSEVGKAAQKVRNLEQLIAGYKKRLDEGNISQAQFDTLVGSASVSLERYSAEFDRLSGATAKAAEKAQDMVEATERVNAAFEASKAGLADEARLLGLANQEREIQGRLLGEIAKIQEEGGPALLPEQEAELLLIIRKNSALQDQADAFDGIRGPQEEFVRQLTALDALLKADTITTEEFNTAVTALAEGADGLDLSNIELPEGVGEGIDFEAQIASLRELLEVEQARIETEQLRASLIDDIVGKEETLRESQIILKQLMDEGVISGEQFREKMAEIDAELNPLSESAQSLADTLASIKDPQEEAALQFDNLNTLLRANTISIDEYNAALKRLPEGYQVARIGAQDLATASDGLVAGFKKGKEGITDVSGAAETLMVNSFGAAEDALVDFATTGEFSFSNFVDGILDDLARLLVRQAFTGLFGGGGEGGGLLSSLFSGGIPGFAAGGDFPADKPFFAGEDGVELITPKGAGSVMDAEDTANLLSGGNTTVQAPDVNVTILNTSDPADMIAAMSSAQGTQLILNAINQNPSQVKNLLQ